MKTAAMAGAMFASANLALLLYGVGTPLNVVGFIVAAVIWFVAGWRVAAAESRR